LNDVRRSVKGLWLQPRPLPGRFAKRHHRE
jgi:hypothetical protein